MKFGRVMKWVVVVVVLGKEREREWRGKRHGLVSRAGDSRLLNDGVFDSFV